MNAAERNPLEKEESASRLNVGASSANVSLSTSENRILTDGE